MFENRQYNEHRSHSLLPSPIATTKENFRWNLEPIDDANCVFNFRFNKLQLKQLVIALHIQNEYVLSNGVINRYAFY